MDIIKELTDLNIGQVLKDVNNIYLTTQGDGLDEKC